jgi:hypothetical protein
MLDPDRFPIGTGITSDVSGRPDVGVAGAEVIVDDHPIVDRQSGSLGQSGAGDDSNPDHYQVGGKSGPVVEENLAISDLGDATAKAQVDPVLTMEVGDETSQCLPHHVGQGDLFGRNHRHLDLPLTERGGHLEADEPRSDHHRSVHAVEGGDDGAAVLESAEVVDVSQLTAGNRETAGLGSRGKEESAVGDQPARVEVH